jgi:hypothetical protein
LFKHRLDKRGNELGIIEHITDDGHAEEKEKEEGDEEREKHINEIVKQASKAMEDGEGCKLSGFVFINKVPGNFHISGHHYPEAVRRVMM